MIQRACGLSFLLKAIQPIGILGKRCRQNFDRHVAAELRIARAIDFAHATFADLGDNCVLSDRCVGGNGFAHTHTRLVFSNRLLHILLVFQLRGPIENHGRRRSFRFADQCADQEPLTVR